MKKVIILIVFLLVIPLAIATPEQDLLNLINKERLNNNLQPLTKSNQLTTAAILHNQDMLTKGYLEHTSSNNISLLKRIRATGFQGRFIGENIGAHSGSTNITHIFQLWKNSSTHHKKILNPKYHYIGLSILEGNYKYFNQYSTIYTTEFGSKPQQLPKKETFLAKIKKLFNF